MIHAETASLRRSELFVLVAATALAMTARGVLAQDQASAKIPAVGDPAADFTLQGLDGQSISLSKLTAQSPVVLVVLRGYPGYQCPICSAQVGNLVSRSQEIADARAKVVFVYPGPGEKLSQRATEFLKAKSLPEQFVMVTDPDYEFTNAYGLRWDAPRETAYPTTFVIDRQGTVRFAKVSKTHGDRANAADIVQSLKALR